MKTPLLLILTGIAVLITGLLHHQLDQARRAEERRQHQAWLENMRQQTAATHAAEAHALQQRLSLHALEADRARARIQAERQADEFQQKRAALWQGIVPGKK